MTSFESEVLTELRRTRELAAQTEAQVSTIYRTARIIVLALVYMMIVPVMWVFGTGFFTVLEGGL